MIFRSHQFMSLVEVLHAFGPHVPIVKYSETHLFFFVEHSFNSFSKSMFLFFATADSCFLREARTGQLLTHLFLTHTVSFSKYIKLLSQQLESGTSSPNAEI